MSGPEKSKRKQNVATGSDIRLQHLSEYNDDKGVQGHTAAKLGLYNSISNLHDKRKNPLKHKQHVLIKKMPVKLGSSNRKSKNPTNNVVTNNKLIKSIKPMIGINVHNTKAKINTTITKNGCIKKKSIKDLSNKITKDDIDEELDGICKIKRVLKNDINSFEIKKCNNMARNKQKNILLRPNGISKNNGNKIGIKKSGKTPGLFKSGELEIKVINNAPSVNNSTDNTQLKLNKNDVSEITNDSIKTDISLLNRLNHGLKLEGQYLGIQPAVKFKCYKCGESNFTTISLLQVHISQCTGQLSSTAISNQICNAGKEKNQTNLRITRRVYLCSSCMTYYQNWDLYVHMRNVHKKQICLYCLVMFSYSTDLWTHLINCHKLDIKKYDNANQLKETFKDSFFLTCCTCNELFTEDDNFIHHECSELTVEKICAYCLCRKGHFPMCPTRNSLCHNKNLSLQLSHRSQNNRNSCSISEEDDYDISDAASFCHVALGDDVMQPTCTLNSGIKNDKHHTNVRSTNTKSTTINRKNLLTKNGDKQRVIVAELEKDVASESIDKCVTSRNEIYMLKNHKSEKGLTEVVTNKVIAVKADSASHHHTINDMTEDSSDTKNDVNTVSNLKTDRTINDIEDCLNTHDKLSNCQLIVTVGSSEEIASKLESNYERKQDEELEGDTKLELDISQLGTNDPESMTCDEEGSINKVNNADNDTNLTIKHENNKSIFPILDASEMKNNEISYQNTGEVNNEDNIDVKHNSFEILTDSMPTTIENVTEGGEENKEENDPDKDVLSMALTLDDDISAVPLLTVIKECVRTSCSNCLYCNNTIYIAVNGKQLVLHLLEKHRYKPIKNNTWQDVVSKLQNGIPELENVYLNTESFDSTDSTCHTPFTRTFACFQCYYITQIQKELYLHKRKMHQKNMFICIMCKCNFSTYSELYCHLCPGTYSRPFCLEFRCCLCGIGNIPSAFRLMVHLRKTHQICDVCLEESDDQQKLHSHLGKHKLHHLCYKCGIAYRSKTDINKHLFWKHGTESVLCKKCLQKKWPYIYHFCTPQLIYMCEECSMTFSKPIALTVHKRLHLNEYPYHCDECTDEKFISKKLLYKHKDKIHNDNPVLDVCSDSKLNITSDYSQEANKSPTADMFGSSSGKVKSSVKENQCKELEKVKKEKIVDDLPPLMLSSDSEDSEDMKTQDTLPESSNNDKSEIMTDRNDHNYGEINDHQYNHRDNKNDSLLKNNVDTNNVGCNVIGESEIQPNETSSVPIIENNTDEQSAKENIWGNLSICHGNDVRIKIEENEENSQMNVNYFIFEHNYCIVNSIIPSKSIVANVANNTGVCNGGGSISDDTSNNGASDIRNHNSSSSYKKLSTPARCNSTPPYTQKHHTKKKNMKNTSNTSSSSSSSSDSEYSSSCSSNCSWSHSSSSSFSSSDSETSSAEKKKTHHKERKQKRKCRERSKQKSDSDITPSRHTESNSVSPNKINESDLDTELSLTDEDFYEKRPLIWQQEKELSNITNMVEIVDPVEKCSKHSPMKKKLKNNKTVKEVNIKNNAHVVRTKKYNNVNRNMENLFRVNNNQVKPNQKSAFPYAEDGNVYNPLSHDSLSDINQSFASSGTSAIMDYNEEIDMSIDNSRQSKRKRVKNKFYGYSTSDEETAEHNRLAKLKKVTNKPNISQQQMINALPNQQRIQSNNALSPNTPFSAKQTIMSPIQQTSLRQNQSPVYPRIIPRQSGIRVLPPVIKAQSTPASTSKSYQIMTPLSDNDSSDSDTEKKVNPLYINVSKGFSTVPNSGAPGTAVSIPRNVISGVKSDNLYCYCQCPYDEVSEMIACDGPNCKIEWFHFECVGIMVPPKGKWFCPGCRKGNKSRW